MSLSCSNRKEIKGFFQKSSCFNENVDLVGLKYSFYTDPNVTWKEIKCMAMFRRILTDFLPALKFTLQGCNNLIKLRQPETSLITNALKFQFRLV